MWPLTAPGGMVKVIWVEDVAVGTVMTLPRRTPTTWSRLVPVTVTGVPTGPVSGATDVIVGGGAIVSEPALVVEPLGVVTVIVPAVAAAGTVKVSVVTDTTEKAALVPSTVTAVAPSRLVPVRMIVEPTAAVAGSNPEIVGGPSVTVNPEPLVVLPVAVVTVTAPEVAPAGTVAVTEVTDPVENVVAGVPLKETPDTSDRPEPLIVTLVPTAPWAGVN